MKVVFLLIFVFGTFFIVFFFFWRGVLVLFIVLAFGFYDLGLCKMLKISSETCFEGTLGFGMMLLKGFLKRAGDCERPLFYTFNAL